MKIIKLNQMKDRAGADGVDTCAPASIAATAARASPADRYSSQVKNNYFTEMSSGSEAGSYLRLIDFCVTQL